MPFVVPIIAGALGLGAVGTALVGIGVSVALGFAARAMAPKPESGGSGGSPGVRLALRYDPSAEREIIIGEAATAGTIVYQNLYGPTGSEFAQMVFALSDCECDGLVSFTINGEAATWNATTGAVTEYADHMWVHCYRGTYDQTANSELVAQSGGRWTANDRGRGVCYVVVTMKYNPTLYQSGVPRFVFRVRGARLYDWRKDSSVAGGVGAHRWGVPSTYEWTANPIVAAYNYRRGIYLNGQRLFGMNTAASALPLDEWTAAANACDQGTAILAGGSEPRFAFNGIVSSATDHRETIRAFMAACAGREIETGGVFKPRPGVARSVALTITDDDLLADGDVEIIPRLPRSQLVNAVFGTWRDPARGFERVAAAPRISPADEAMDGGIRLEASYDIENVTSRTQAQRVLEFLRREGRHQMTVRLRLRARFMVLEAGDWVAWTSVRHGMTGQTFRVEQATVAADGTIAVMLRAISAAVYAWSTSDEVAEDAPSTVGSGGPTMSEVPALSIASVSIAGAGETARPGLRATWTPITDYSVVSIIFEYRKAGDATGVMQKTALQPASGQLMWVDGVQGGVNYEVRARIETEPARPVTWSGWIAADVITTPFVVDIAKKVPPGAISPEALDMQTKFELSLSSAGEATQGAATQFRDEIVGLIQDAGVNAMLAAMDASEAAALVTIEKTERTTETGAIAALVSTTVTRVDGNTAAITTQQASIDGLKAQYVIALDINGRATGIKLAGTATTTDLVFLLDNLRMAAPGINGGAPVPLFAVETVTVGGVPQAQMFLNGAIKAKSAQFSSLSAVTTEFGDAVFSGIARGTNNKMILDFTTPRFRMVA